MADLYHITSKLFQTWQYDQVFPSRLHFSSDILAPPDQTIATQHTKHSNQDHGGNLSTMMMESSDVTIMKRWLELFVRWRRPSGRWGRRSPLSRGGPPSGAGWCRIVCPPFHIMVHHQSLLINPGLRFKLCWTSSQLQWTCSNGSSSLRWWNWQGQDCLTSLKMILK